MIITRTPMRISLVGGGTDLPEFYRHHDGAVISMGIDKYVYIMLSPRFDGQFRVSYSRTEIAQEAKDIQHDIVRETMKLFGFKGMEVVSVSDIPGDGSGLGSSSSFTVGLILAACGLIGKKLRPSDLAEAAFNVEREKCKHPVGKQDHYAAATGHLAHYLFKKNGDVVISSLGLIDEELAALRERMMLFWTGVGRSSTPILVEQAKAIQTNNDTFETGLVMVELVNELRKQLEEGKFNLLGRAVGVDWKLKRSMAKGITADWIESRMAAARLNGAEGSKICGAGGGGFMLVVAPPEKQEAIAKMLWIKQVPFKIGVKGSTIIYAGE